MIKFLCVTPIIFDATSVILEAESETSDFYIVLSGDVRVVMRFAFEETGSKSIHESDAYIHTPKVRCPTELTICKLGRQNTFGDFYHGRKARSPVAFVADSSEVFGFWHISTCCTRPHPQCVREILLISNMIHLYHELECDACTEHFIRSLF